MIRTIWGDPDRYKTVLLPGGVRRQALPRGRRLGARQDARLLHDHGPHRRRAQRLGAPPRHDGDRVGAGRQSAGRRGRGGRPPRRPDRRGGLRVRRAEAGAARRARRRRRSRSSCATGSARRSARSPSPRTSASATTCRRRAPARSCAGCCARSPRTRRSRRTSRRWKIRRSLEQLKAGSGTVGFPRRGRISAEDFPPPQVAVSRSQNPAILEAVERGEVDIAAGFRRRISCSERRPLHEIKSRPFLRQLDYEMA